MARRVDQAILRRKLKAVRTTRALYRLAKGFVTLDGGDIARTQLGEMKRTLVPVRKKRFAAAGPTSVTGPK
jgi:hypothetical protein